MIKKEFSCEIGGKTLTAEFNDLAENANGSVVVRYGDTVVLATAVMGGERPGLDYFPLTVDYEERFYAAGQILGSRFMRREGRPSDEAVLSGRAIDRTIRPLFDSRMRIDVQVVITILSLGEDDPDVLAIIAASLALGTSDIPWAGPVSAVRLGKVLNLSHNLPSDLPNELSHESSSWAVNPSYELRQSETTSADILVCGKDGMINMLEVGAKELPEDEVKKGFEHALEEIEKLQDFQKKIIAEVGKPKREFVFAELSEEAKKLFEEKISPKLPSTVFSGAAGKDTIHELADEWAKLVAEKLPDENAGLASAHFESQVEKTLDDGALKENKRADGRGFDDIRQISVQAGGVAPRLHGAGIFYRGGTHVLSALTLGGPEDSLIIDAMEVQTKKRFMHHYNFPPFSTGETGRMGGMNRRALGHGALAEKALAPVIPPKETFPYTIRVVSEVLSSNGSSSMGSVCASTLALMDGGVAITAPVAGIAMGLVLGENSQLATRNSDYRILTDIQGPEDEHGDMDFKVAGTRSGVTAVQMDVKVGGVPLNILAEALEKAKNARLKILDVIESEIAAPRAELSPFAPRIMSMKIKKEFIGMVIGSGGKTVNQIRDLTGADISIEEDGTVYLTGLGDGPAKAKQIIEIIAREYLAGERLEGVVTRIADFGAFVRLGEESPVGGMKDTEGLVHVSEIAPFRIGSVYDVLAVGEHVPVVVKEIGEEGKIRLSIKDADPEFAAKKGAKPSADFGGDNGARGERNGFRGDRGPRRGWR